MASSQAVKAALKLLSVNFAGDVTAEKVKLWHSCLDDVTDETLSEAVPRVIREHAGQFIPSVGFVRQMCGANTVSFDAEGLRREIAALGSYNPQSGWSPPRRETVAEILGEGVASAYGMVGGERLFGAGTTRDIALRDFTEELKSQVETRGRDALQAPPERPQIVAPVKGLIANVQRDLAARELGERE